MNPETDTPPGGTGPNLRAAALIVMILLFMGFLGMILLNRLGHVDPIQRCTDAYASSYNAVDTTLVDRMKVRTPDRTARTTCGALRKDDLIHPLPRPAPGPQGM